LFSASFLRFLTMQARALAQEVGGPAQLDPLRELGLNLWALLTWPINIALYQARSRERCVATNKLDP